MDGAAKTARDAAPGRGWRSARSRAAARRLKRGGDVGGALVILVFAAPLLAAVALSIKLQDGGPVLFRHIRCGRGGRAFGLWKFRTMRVDAAESLSALLARDPGAEAEWLRRRKLRDDPRITRVGRFLRRSSLDELPQLANVLRGEMSLVGPRPIMAEELAAYGAARPAYEAVRPGLTGLWQVSGRNALSFERRVALDAAYARGWSLRLDAAILCRTVPVVLSARGAY